MKNIPFEGYLGPRLPREVQLQRLKNVIETELTDNQREILMEYYFTDTTMTQIARERGVCLSTVSRTLHRAENKLRRYLKY